MNKSRILVVDDEPNLSGLIRHFLEKTQLFEVRVENRSALVLSVARVFYPDLILLDIDMPGKDGGDVAREIEMDPILHDVPIIFVTSLISRLEVGESAVVRDGRHFLAKPVNMKALIATVNSVLAGESRVG